MVDIQRVVQPGQITAEAYARTTAIPLAEGNSIFARADRVLPNGATRFLSQSGVLELALQTALKPGTLVRITAQPGGFGGEARLTVQILNGALQGPARPAPQTTPPPAATPSPGAASTGAAPSQAQTPAPVSTAPAQAALSFMPAANAPQTPIGANAAASLAQTQTANSQIAASQNAVSASAYQRTATLSAGLPSAAPAIAASAGQAAATSQPAIVAQTVHRAVASQNSVAPLLGSLGAIMAQPQQRAALPPALDGVMRHLLGVKLDLNSNPSGGNIKSAQMQSGIFQEAALARGLPPGDGAPDMKSALLNLRSVLSSMRGDTASPRLPAAKAFTPPPPVRGQLPGAQRVPAAVNLTDFTTGDGLTRLLEMTEAALHRLRLSQVSSLNGGELVRDLGTSTNVREWNFEIPALFGQTASVMQFQIAGDDRRSGDPAERTWTMRFALDFEETGPVSAEVTLRGITVGIVLRAEREEIAARLSEGEPRLRTALEAAGLTLGRLSVHSHEDHAASPHAGAMADQTA